MYSITSPLAIPDTLRVLASQAVVGGHDVLHRHVVPRAVGNLTVIEIVLTVTEVEVSFEGEVAADSGALCKHRGEAWRVVELLVGMVSISYLEATPCVGDFGTAERVAVGA